MWQDARGAQGVCGEKLRPFTVSAALGENLRVVLSKMYKHSTSWMPVIDQHDRWRNCFGVVRGVGARVLERDAEKQQRPFVIHIDDHRFSRRRAPDCHLGAASVCCQLALYPDVGSTACRL